MRRALALHATNLGLIQGLLSLPGMTLRSDPRVTPEHCQLCSHTQKKGKKREKVGKHNFGWNTAAPILGNSCFDATVVILSSCDPQAAPQNLKYRLVLPEQNLKAPTLSLSGPRLFLALMTAVGLGGYLLTPSLVPCPPEGSGHAGLGHR